MAENTFLGLQPYTEADAYRFKGRTEDSQELFRLIVRNDYMVCYAESGEGKTSLLNAGVFPLLRENMFFPIAITFTCDDYQHTPDSFDAIIDRCIKDSIADYNEKNKGINIEYKLCSTDFQGTDRQSALQQELSKYSWWKLRNYKPQAMGLTFTPVFVFDQFEEVFNLPGSIVWTKKFFDWLEDVSSDSCPEEIIKKVREIIGTNAAFPAIKEEKDFKAVFSLRKEFIGELDYWGMQKCFITSLKDNRYCLKALTYEGAKKVMTQQQRFVEDKVEQVLRYFVQQYSREPEKTIAENLPVIPAILLSVVCDSWEKDINYFSGKEESEIGQALNNILEQFYDKTISDVVSKISKQDSSMSSDSIRKEIDIAMSVLVDANGKRVRTKTTSTVLTQIDFDKKYKKALSDGRIIRIIKIDGEDYVEVVHDSLCSVIVKKEIEKLTEGNAFISYTRSDEKWAKWLQYKLEHYKLPSSLNERTDLPRTIRVLNNDTKSLASGNLSQQVHENIKRSKYLIVICSPQSVQSVWVNKDVEMFVSMGRADQIIPFIIEGEPNANEPSVECFPRALRQLPKDKELLGVNVNETGKEAAVARLIARMLNVGFDVIWQRHKRQHRRKIIVRVVCLMAIIVSVLGLWAWSASQPFNVEIRLIETSIYNKELAPYSRGVITLDFGNEVSSDTVSVEDGRCVFLNIPKQYYNRDAHVKFESPYYFSVDTIISLTETFHLNIVRDPDIFGHVHFRLWSIYAEMPVTNCKITISNRSQDSKNQASLFSIETTPDESGLIDIHIPIEEQRSAYSIFAGYPLETSIIYMPCGADDVVLIKER